MCEEKLGLGCDSILQLKSIQKEREVGIEAEIQAGDHASSPTIPGQTTHLCLEARRPQATNMMAQLQCQDPSSSLVHYGS